MKEVIVFLSTPRCGTQWLAKNLSEIYSEVATVLHEPILYDYYPRLNLGRYDSPLMPEDNPKLAKHLDFIEEESQHKKYIEVGWQSIAGIAEFYRMFRDRLKVIHLYRNPIYVASSLVTIDFYKGHLPDRFEKAEVHPFDEIALLDEYRERWENLTRYEKSLYYWTEINLRAIEIKHRYQDLPFYSLKFEDLFKKSKESSRITLLEMLSFMGLEYESSILKSIKIPHDEYHYTTNLSIDWKKIEEHQQTMVLANKLGYSLDKEINLARYRRPLKQKIAAKVPVKVQKVLKSLTPFKIQEILNNIPFN